MSKKSRKRNKKILGILAAGLGAAALAKRKKASMASMDDAGIGATHPALFSKDWITKKDTAPAVVAAPISKTKFRTRGGITDSAGKMIDSAGMTLNRRIPGAVAPPSILNPYRAPRGFHPRASGNINQFNTGSYKKGGRVTGIAKRGFGRALMKGKK